MQENEDGHRHNDEAFDHSAFALRTISEDSNADASKAPRDQLPDAVVGDAAVAGESEAEDGKAAGSEPGDGSVRIIGGAPSHDKKPLGKQHVSQSSVSSVTECL